jgi:hypothetical protein
VVALLPLPHAVNIPAKARTAAAAITLFHDFC